jgi:hypothetical protein
MYDTDNDSCPRCYPQGCDCSDSERPGHGDYDANLLPDGRRCRCGAHAAGGDCMCFED